MANITTDSGEISTEQLRARAKELGIKFTKNTSDDILLEKIEAIEKATKVVEDKQNSYKESMALQHVQITTLDPYIQKLPYIFRQISNAKISLRKAIYLNKPMFLEKCMCDLLTAEKFMQLEDNTNLMAGGRIQAVPKQTYVNRFQIHYLDQPSETEWKNDEKWKSMRKNKTTNDIQLADKD